MKTTTPCNCCAGIGEVTESVCISEFLIPRRHANAELIVELKIDALKAKGDHRKLCGINPRAKESYDEQLAATLAKLNAEAEALFAA